MKLSIPGLVMAAAIAPGLTMAFGSILLWLFETLPFIAEMDGAPIATQELFGYTSFWSEIRRSLGELLFDVLVGPLLSIVFGLVGAAIFLAPSFAIASLRADIRSYVIAGGLSGAAHAAGGILITPLLAGPYPELAVALGFTPYGIRHILTVTTAVSAPAAGILTGYLYGRLVGPRPVRDGKPE